MLREQSCRHIVANDRGRRRLIGSQTGVGSVARLQERVEPKRKQTKYDHIRRDGDTDCRTRSVYTITGHVLDAGLCEASGVALYVNSLGSV